MPESTFAKCSPRCASDVATKSAAAWIFRSIMVGAAPCAYTESAAVSVQHRCSSFFAPTFEVKTTSFE